jgi:hypothetical protein
MDKYTNQESMQIESMESIVARFSQTNLHEHHVGLGCIEVHTNTYDVLTCPKIPFSQLKK